MPSISSNIDDALISDVIFNVRGGTADPVVWGTRIFRAELRPLDKPETYNSGLDTLWYDTIESWFKPTHSPILFYEGFRGV